MKKHKILILILILSFFTFPTSKAHAQTKGKLVAKVTVTNNGSPNVSFVVNQNDYGWSFSKNSDNNVRFTVTGVNNLTVDRVIGGVLDTSDSFSNIKGKVLILIPPTSRPTTIVYNIYSTDSPSTNPPTNPPTSSGTDLTELYSLLNKLGLKIDDINLTIKNGNITIINKITEINNNITNVNNNLTNINNNITKVNNNLTNINNNITNVNNTIKNLITEVQKINNQLTTTREPKKYTKPDYSNKLEQNKPTQNNTVYEDKNTYYPEIANTEINASMPQAPDPEKWDGVVVENPLLPETEQSKDTENTQDTELSKDDFIQDSEITKDNFTQDLEISKDSELTNDTFTKEPELTNDKFTKEPEFKNDNFNKDSELTNDKFVNTENFENNHWYQQDVPFQQTEKGHNKRWQSIKGVFK